MKYRNSFKKWVFVILLINICNFISFTHSNQLLADNTFPYSVNLVTNINTKLDFDKFQSIYKNEKIYINIENDYIYNTTQISIIVNQTNDNLFDYKLFEDNLNEKVNAVNSINFFPKVIQQKTYSNLITKELVFQSKRKNYILLLTESDRFYYLTKFNSKLEKISSQKLIEKKLVNLQLNNKEVSHLYDNKNNNLYVHLGDKLFLLDLSGDNIYFELIDENIRKISNNVINNQFYYIKELNNQFSLICYYKGEKSELTELEYSKEVAIYNFVQPQKNNQKKKSFEQVYILNGYENTTLLNAIGLISLETTNGNECLKKVVNSEKIWLDGNINANHILTFDNESLLLLHLQKNSELNEILSLYKLDNLSKNLSKNLSNQIKMTSLEDLELFHKHELENPLNQIIYTKVSDNYLYILGLNTIIIFDSKFNNLANEKVNLITEIKDISQIINEVNFIINEYQILISINDKSYLLELERNNFWYFNRIYNSSGKYILPIIILVLFIYLFQKNKRQKRLINTLLELPGTGFILVFDNEGRLLTINSTTRDLLKIDYNVPLKKYFKYYCNTEYSIPLFDFFQKTFETKVDFSQRLNLIIDNKVREYFCHSKVVRNVAGNFRGVIITGIDITEELERQRLSNWAQLAHDLQTNLSIIKLNAENLESIVNDADKPRLEKIAQQTNIIFHRIRDLVTVGRTNKINKSSYKSAEIIDEIVGEFDLSLIPNIIINKNIQNFDVYCDKPKLIRCIRNATENSIKVIKQIGGEITIHAKIENKYAIFIVEDNGPGMDETIKKRMLSPFFTTNQEDGGSGIGTMIMLNVMEQHGGKLFVESEKGKGTQMIFKFPNVKA